MRSPVILSEWQAPAFVREAEKQGALYCAGLARRYGFTAEE